MRSVDQQRNATFPAKRTNALPSLRVSDAAIYVTLQVERAYVVHLQTVVHQVIT